MFVCLCVRATELEIVALLNFSQFNMGTGVVNICVTRITYHHDNHVIK